MVVSHNVWLETECGRNKEEGGSINRKEGEGNRRRRRKDGVSGCGALTREKLKGMGQRMVGEESRNGAGGMK